MGRVKGTSSPWRRAVLIVGVILVGVIVARAFGFTAYLRLENLSRLTINSRMVNNPGGAVA